MNPTPKTLSYKNMFSFFILIVSSLLASQTVYSQTITLNPDSIVTIELKNEVKNENSQVTNLTFAVWFMGSKQDPNTKISSEILNQKKQILTSGSVPNRLLIKVFLKKMVSTERDIA